MTSRKSYNFFFETHSFHSSLFERTIFLRGDLLLRANIGFMQAMSPEENRKKERGLRDSEVAIFFKINCS